MTGRAVPLSEALERFSDPDAWAECAALKRYDLPLTILGGPEREEDRLAARYRRLAMNLERKLLDRLRRGELTATGFVYPVALDPERRVIPPERWKLLQASFETSEAVGGGIKLVEIEVHEPGAGIGSADARDQRGIAQLRADVRRWLQREARERGSGWQKKHYREAARERFGERLSDNLFREIWRAAELPDALRRPGLRKRGR